MLLDAPTIVRLRDELSLDGFFDARRSVRYSFTDWLLDAGAIDGLSFVARATDERVLPGER